MPYSFLQIEHRKRGIINAVFFLLVLIYVAILALTVLAVDISLGIELTRHLLVIQFLYVLVFAVVIAAVHFYISVNALTKKMVDAFKARRPDLQVDKEKTFQNIIEEVCAATGGTQIKGMIIPGAAMNAVAVDDYESVPFIAVTEGLLLRLTRAQLEAVVAYEAAHILTGSTLQVTIASSIFDFYNAILRFIKGGSREPRGGYYVGGGWGGGSSGGSSDGSSSGSGGSRDRSGGSGQALILVLIIVLIIILLSILAYFLRFFISRQRTYKSDAIAVRLTRDPASLAEALYVMDAHWGGQGLSWGAMEDLFIVNPRYKEVDEQEGFWPNLASTHAPVAKRIAILLDMAHVKREDFERDMQPRVKLLEQQAEEEERKQYWASVKQDVLVSSCPRCSARLDAVAYEGVSILRCPQCAGYFAKEDQVGMIFVRRQETFAAEAQQMARVILEQPQISSSAAQAPVNGERLTCPLCRQSSMVRRLFNELYPVEVDKCCNCAGTWFDKNELEIMQCVYESRNPAKS